MTHICIAIAFNEALLLRICLCCFLLVIRARLISRTNSSKWHIACKIVISSVSLMFVVILYIILLSFLFYFFFTNLFPPTLIPHITHTHTHATRKHTSRPTSQPATAAPMPRKVFKIRNVSFKCCSSLCWNFSFVGRRYTL